MSVEILETANKEANDQLLSESQFFLLPIPDDERYERPSSGISRSESLPPSHQTKTLVGSLTPSFRRLESTLAPDAFICPISYQVHDDY